MKDFIIKNQNTKKYLKKIVAQFSLWKKTTNNETWC